MKTDVPPALAIAAMPDDAYAERASFEQVYDQSIDFAWRMVVRLGVPTAQVEDAVQDVFLVVHRKLNELQREVPPRAWVAGIAVKVAHDYRRTLKRKAPGVPLDEAEHVADGEDPSASTTRREARDLVLELLETLDENQRTVFVLAELEELTAPEISDITGAGLNTVYSRLRLARARFDEAVARYRAAGGSW